MKRLVLAVVVVGFISLFSGVVQAQGRESLEGRLQQAPLTELFLVPADTYGLASSEAVVFIHDFGEFRLVALPAATHSGEVQSPRFIPVEGVEKIQYRSWEGSYQSISGVSANAPTEVGLLALVGPVDPNWARQIENTGAEVLDRAPPYGLVVSASPTQLAACARIQTSFGFQAVRGWIPMPVEATISSDLMPIVTGERAPGEIPGLMRGPAGSAYVRIFPYPNKDRERVFEGVRKFAPQVRANAPYGYDDVFEVNGPEILDIVENLGDVAFVEGVYERQLHNNLAVQDYIMNVEPVWVDLGWDGTGVIVDHNDSGADLTHPDLAGKILATSGAMSNTDNGHGTHTAGSVAGRGGASTSPTNTSGCGDQNPPLTLIKGSAPGAELVCNNIFDGGASSEDVMMRWGYQNGAHLSTNSWGYGTLSTYSSYAVTVDGRVRDADTTAAGNQEFPIIFSAGNAGPGASTIGTPGNGKNTLTVGASQNDRCGSYIPSNCAGPSIDLMACFSSRGPAQGRILPDVVGVGADVISVESGDSQATQPWDESWTGADYALSPGTSMSCPLVAGAAAVFYEFYFATFAAEPSPALVKAAMINGAIDMGYGYPSYDQGWGRVDLRRSIEGPPGGEIKFVDQASVTPLSTGGSWSLPFTVGSSAIPLKITVDWTDPPGAANCSSCLINDLDLVVTSPSGTVYKGNQFTADWSAANPAGKDSINNVENVFVEAPETGNWTIEVVSANTSQNPPGLTGQDFAVVYSGSFCGAAFPTGLSATPNGDNQIDLSWSAASGATEYRIYRSQTSGGPYSQIGTSGSTSYSDLTVSGSVTYYYVVTNFTDCESPQSSEAFATATGICTAPPNFAGIANAVNGSINDPCTINLEWTPATTSCAGPITYRVFRDTSTGFTPGAGNQIAGGVTCSGSPCTYSDTDTLISGTEYFYAVRAVDTSNLAEDSNTAEASAIPTGLGGGTTNYPSTDTPIAIPDNNAGGISSILNIASTGTISDILLNVNITHTYKGDLTVRLTSPSGTAVTVHAKTGAGTNDIVTTYDVPTAPDGPGLMSDFDGESFTGNWTLFVSDTARVDTGTLNNWSLDITVDNPCTTGGSCTDPGAVTIGTITDDDACAQNGVTIPFSGGAGASSFDLWVDGSQVATGITSPYSYNPGDSASHSYVVRAVDSSCFTDSGASLFTDADNTPAAPAVPVVSDVDACAQSGVTVTWTDIGADGYNLRIDGVGGTTITGVTSPYSYNPLDSASHTYDLQATDVTCGAGPWSGVTTATDEEGAPGTPAAPTVVDIAACAVNGVQISWGAVSGATSYDLLVDGLTTVTGVSSPYTYSPGDSATHTYSVRAVNICGNGAWSTAIGGVDGDHSFAWAGIDVASDRDACDDTGVATGWSIPADWNDGGIGSRTYTLYRSGATVAAGLTEFVIGIDDIAGVNGTTYNYSVEAFNGYGCSAGGSSILPASDEVGSEPSFSGLQSVTAMPGDICGLRLEWNAATSNCVNGPTIVYNVYRSTTPGFTPDAATLHDSCVTDLFYEDHTIVGGTTYYYVVRAEDSSLGHGGPCGNGFEDSNAAEVSGIVSSGTTTVTVYSDDFDGNQTPADYWNTGYSFGNPYTAGDSCNDGVGNETYADDWHLPESGGSCTSNAVASNDGVSPFAYSSPNNGALVLGDPPVGGGPPYSDGGIVLPAGASSITLTFNQDYDFENNWDGGRVMVSADDWPTFTAITPVGGYPDTISTSTNWCFPWPGEPAYSGDSGGCVSAEFDLTAYAGQRVWLAWNHGGDNDSTNDDGWFIDDVLIEAVVPGTACTTAADPVQHLAARSTFETVKLEWQNPAGGAYSTTRVCVDTTAFPTDPTTCTLAGADQAAGLNNYDTMTLTGLTNGQNFYFTAFVDNGSGAYSPAQTVMARPFNTSGQTKWSYHTAATALAPPGLYPGTAGTGASYGVSNDRVLHGMNSTTGGGDWPRTAPFDWLPMGMNGPAQSRPPIVPTTVLGADLVAFLGSQDGHVYAVNAKSGTTLWQSAQNYGLVQGAPAGMFTAFPGAAYDLLFAGSRVAGSGNSMFGIHPADGSAAWNFGGTMGIISSGPTVDYASNRLYFASRENASGSNHTLWCLSFTDTGAALVWSKPYGDIDSAPVLFDGVLYVGTNAGTVMAVDPLTGDQLWTYATNDGPVKGYVDYEFVTGTPRKLFFATTNNVWAVTDNGTFVSPEWVRPMTGPSIPLTLADEGALYVGSTNGSLYQLDAADGSIVTSVVMGAGTATVGSPGYDWINSLAYVGAEDGSVYAVALPLAP